MVTTTEWANYDAVSNSKQIQHLVVIDSKVCDYSDLARGVIPGAKVIILEPDQDGVKQITQALNGDCYPISLHIVSHGSPGCLYLGNTQLSLDTLDEYTEELGSWFPVVRNIFSTGAVNKPLLSPTPPRP